MRLVRYTNMLRRTIGAALAATAVIAAGAIIKLVLDNTENFDEEDDEVNFINIEDGDEVTPEVQEIAKLYPYLDKKFIAEQFGRNEVFNKEYPEDTLITIAHKAKFDDAWTLQEYAKIVEDNGYTVSPLNETENIVSKKMFTTEGAILSDIYNVANQVACLKGVYEGYKIDK